MEKKTIKGNGAWLVGLLVSLVLFLVMMAGVKNGSILRFDDSVQGFFQGIESTAGLKFFESISTLGTTLVIGGGSLLFLLWLWFKQRNYWAMAIFAIGVGGGNVLNKFVKNSMARERPAGSLEAEAASYSFPSGHTMVGLVFYVLLVYFITKELKSKSVKWVLGIVVSVLLLIMGISRVGLYAHYASDVIAGYALGAVWTLICVYVYKKKSL